MEAGGWRWRRRQRDTLDAADEEAPGYCSARRHRQTAGHAAGGSSSRAPQTDIGKTPNSIRRPANQFFNTYTNRRTDLEGRIFWIVSFVFGDMVSTLLQELFSISSDLFPGSGSFVLGIEYKNNHLDTFQVAM